MRVFRNVLGLLVNQLGSWSITLLMTLAVPSYLGPERFGLYSFVHSFAGFFTLGMTLGTGTYLTWRIAREPEMAPRLTFNTLALQVPLAVLCSLVALAVTPKLDGRPVVLAMLAVMLLANTLSSLNGTCVAALNGFQIIRAPAFINLGFAAVSVGIILAALHLHIDLFTFVALGLVGEVGALTAIAIYMLRRIPLKPRLEFALWPIILRGGIPFFTWSAVLLFYWQIDIALLKVLVGDTVLGWYAAANRIASIPAFLPSIVVAALLPALSQERSATPRFKELVSRSLRLVTLVSVPAATGLLMLASSLVRLLHYPDSYQQATPLIAILAFNITPVAVDMILGTALIALGRQRAWTCIGIVAAVANPLTNLWAIPYTQQRFGNGAIGASLTTLLSEVILFGGAMVLRPKGLFSAGDVFYIARALLAAGIMIPAVWALASVPQIGIIAAVLYGMVIYAMAAYTLQLVRNDDLLALVGMVSGRLGAGSLERLAPAALLATLGTRAAATRDRVAGQVWGLAARLGVRARVAAFRAALGRGAASLLLPLEQRAGVAADLLSRRLNNWIFSPLNRMTPAAAGPVSGEVDEHWVKLIFEDEAEFERNTAPLPALRWQTAPVQVPHTEEREPVMAAGRTATLATMSAASRARLATRIRERR